MAAHEIRCPNCGAVFQADESDYNRIASQVRDSEFEKELKRREAEEARRRKEDDELRRREYDIRLLRDEKEFSASIAEKDRELSDKEKEIERLKALLNADETERKLAVTEAVKEKELELTKKASEIENLKRDIRNIDAESRLNEKSLKERYEEKLKLKDEEIAYYRDFKARESTKMIGESLERHCMAEFNSIRATAFPNAYFEKDNDAKSGSKGDFIFRESDASGTEFISIMFEMKNEADGTAAKHKNEDFFKELDRDRREKNCEYAILVSLLETDNELYNNGIVDVSYRFPKMYVIRPQFFIPIITLLRNAALNSLKYREELRLVKSQQLDVVRFEENMTAFKESFGRTYRLASERFASAIEEIDKVIDHLKKTKEALLLSEKHLRTANDKANDLSIKKLTKNAPHVKELFEAKMPDEDA